MKIKKKTVWKQKGTEELVRVSRLRENEVLYYPASGGGKEQRLNRDQFLKRYDPVEGARS